MITVRGRIAIGTDKRRTPILVENIASNVTVSTDIGQSENISWNEGRRVVEYGLGSLLEVVCQICSGMKLISTGKRNEKGAFDINSKVALGQFSCGNKKCKETEGLRSWEVNFGYMEHGEKKNALVKLRLCPDCSYKLNYHHRKKEILPKSKRKDKSQHKKQKTEEMQSDKDSSLDETFKKPPDQSTSQKPDSIEDKSIWSGPAKLPDEKSREEEFDDYFEDMFL
ncbi:protein FRA10AC1 [Mytilus galloprovincialis]|uniref:Protein FRA10AC1 n=1 Tax=Mytilus galloprovincialis TaxID=29158 RepID=A0A8B6BFQ0_MYTGA|nr:protein FRA10AC1 [Mytilus galloprovincialis]